MTILKENIDNVDTTLNTINVTTIDFIKNSLNAIGIFFDDAIKKMTSIF